MSPAFDMELNLRAREAIAEVDVTQRNVLLTRGDRDRHKLCLIKSLHSRVHSYIVAQTTLSLH